MSDMPAPLGWTVTREIARDHPAFDGHFPGAPVLPGVALLALVMEALAQRPAHAPALTAPVQIDQAKFLSPVGPGMVLALHLQPDARGLAFTVNAGPTVVARGHLSGGA